MLTLPSPLLQIGLWQCGVCGLMELEKVTLISLTDKLVENSGVKLEILLF